jgi:hypothetical protein
MDGDINKYVSKLIHELNMRLDTQPDDVESKNYNLGLETAKNTGDIIIRNRDRLSIRYNIATESFVFWDRVNEQFYKHEGDETGYNQVVLSDKLFSEDWYLEPVSKIEPININGRKFTDCDKAIQHLDTLKRRREALHLYEKICKETCSNPILLADKETIDFINKELNRKLTYRFTI